MDMPVASFSGGWRMRLNLAQALICPSDLLLLDEPTNHLDLASKEVLKQALMRYDGTLLVVSHDRDFLHGLTNLVYEIKPDRLRVWPGDVLDFLKEKKAETIAMFEKNKQQAPPKTTSPVVSDNSVSREEQRERDKQKKKLEIRLQKCEQDIERLEREIAVMNEQIAQLDYTDAEGSKKKLDAYALMKSQLDSVMLQWEETGSELAGFD
jgi:ATP-binding cassette subfamily F protein 3